MDSKKPNTKIHLAVNLALTGFFAAVFSVLAFVTLKSQDREVLEKSNQQLEDAVNTLKFRLETENKISREKVSESLRMFIYFLRQSGQIVQEKDSSGRQATNFVTGETSYERVPRWTVRGRDISYLNNIIENVYSLTGTQSAVYQKIPEGYLIVASNFDHSDKQLLTDIFIPNTSDIVPMIENGEIYEGNIKILKKQFVTAFFPLFLDAKISGMVSSMKRYEISKDLIEYVKNKTIFKSGYLFIVTPSANVFVHPELTNIESLHAERILNKIKTDVENSNIVSQTFKMPEKDYQVCQKTLYLKELDTYIGVCCPESELGVASGVKWKIILLFAGLWLISILLLLAFNTLFFKLFSRIQNFVYMVSKGKVPAKSTSKVVSKMEVRELAKIQDAVNSIIDNKNKRLELIEKLTKGDFESELQAEKGKDD